MIDTGNVIVVAITTGICSKLLGWPGFIGSILGTVLYYSWARAILFG